MYIIFSLIFGRLNTSSYWAAKPMWFYTHSSCAKLLTVLYNIYTLTMSITLGDCTVCSSLQAKLLSCFLCQSSVHAFDCKDGKKLCTPSLYNMLENTSKLYPNFFFICDSCMTNKEIAVNSAVQVRMDNMESKVASMENSLVEIKNLIKSNNKPAQANASSISAPGVAIIGECWSNEEKMAEIKKARVSKSALVIPKSNVNISILEKTIVDSKVQISKTFKNKSGETIIVCDSSSSRDKLSNDITVNLPNVGIIKKAGTMLPTVAIVGFSSTFAEDPLSVLVHQNRWLSDYFDINTIGDHITHLFTKPLRNDESVYQAIFNVSPSLREYMKKHGDRIILGMNSCKIYERFHVKRCSLCQLFGHYHKECPNKSTPSCSICSDDHETKLCKISIEEEVKHSCINCKRVNPGSHSNHMASSIKCPQYVAAQGKVKDLIARLN